MIAVALVTAFFIHEIVDNTQPDIELARVEWSKAKSERTDNLNILKELTKDTQEYQQYWKSKIKTDKLFLILQKEKSKNHFSGFQNIHQFLGEFGWAFGLFLIGLYMLIRDILRSSKLLKAELLIDGTIIAISLFFISWALTNGQDFSRATYFVFNLLLSITICYGVYILIKHKESYLKKLKNTIQLLLKFTMRWRFKTKDTEAYSEDLMDTLDETGITNE